MLSEAAQALLSTLTTDEGRRLCVPCARVFSGASSFDVLKSVRELVTQGHALCGQFRCSVCRRVELVVYARPFKRGP
jgi:hypothetical protein